MDAGGVAIVQCSAAGRGAYLTVTFTCALVQQHWKPPPPSPEMSFACARRMYSPGAREGRRRRRLAVGALSIAGFALGELDVAGTAVQAPRRARDRAAAARPASRRSPPADA